MAIPQKPEDPDQLIRHNVTIQSWVWYGVLVQARRRGVKASVIIRDALADYLARADVPLTRKSFDSE